MQGDIISGVILPIGLAFIMFTLGCGLTLADFRRVFLYPRAFGVGLFCHFILLPLVMFGLVKFFGLTGAMAVGYMIVSACPTGTTSNLLTYHARADVALALSFTAVAGLLAIVTVPVILDWSMNHFMGSAQEFQLPYGMVMSQIFMILGLPVGLGMLLRAKARALTHRWHARMSQIATLLFALIVIAAVAKNWDLLVEHAVVLAPLGIAVNVIMLTLGFSLSRLAGVSLRQSATVAIESSVQNSTLAIVIASTILQNDPMAVPAAIYSAFMYLTGIAFVFVMRRYSPPLTAAEEAAAQAAMH